MPDDADNLNQQALLASLNKVRPALLGLHKALLDHERIRYEQMSGRIESAGELLRLVINDPWFAWLQPLTSMIVQIDELIEADEFSAVGAVSLLEEASRLLHPEEEVCDFQREYLRALQESPEVIMAHAEWKRLAPPKKKPRADG